MRRTSWILALPLAMASTGSVPAWAQTGEVVQATPSAAAVDSLNRNLALLSRTPQDVNALLGAGQAALDLGDVQAANGFYTRANMVNPNLGKAKLGLAIVQIALKQAEDAAANFDAAEALGESARGHLAERGLAYDLIGEQAKAQRDYLAAIQANPTDKLARLRYGVSLGISGDIAAANQQLDPALAAGDREAWRMRAFIFAMNGRMADARKVTQAVMPKGLADALDPYMARVSLLTPAQKAAAAYYGEFPSNVLRLTAPEPAKDRPVQVATAATSAEDRDTKRDRRSSKNSDRRSSRATSSQSSEPTLLASRTEAMPASAPPPERTPPAPDTQRPAISPSAQIASNTGASVRSASAGMSPSASMPRATPSVVQGTLPARQPTPKPNFEAPSGVQLTSRSVEAPVSTSRTASSLTAQDSADSGVESRFTTRTNPSLSTTPAPGFSTASGPLTAQAPASAAPRLSLADTLSALSVPEDERKAAPAADLAAVARIQDQRRKASEAAAAKAKADAEAKAKAEAAKKAEAERKKKLADNPSRSWVQIATGRDVDALAFDLRRLRRTYADAVGDTAGWTAEWGATRRLLIGPYKKVEDARAAVTKITKSGGDAFVWQSDAGEEVAKIGGK